MYVPYLELIKYPGSVAQYETMYLSIFKQAQFKQGDFLCTHRLVSIVKKHETVAVFISTNVISNLV